MSNRSADPANVQFSLPTMYHSHFWTAAFADLNYGKAAQAEQSGAFKAVTEAADKWVRMGVDGFRLDAVKHIYHNAYNDENPTFLKKFYDRMNESYKAAGGEGDFYMVGEMLDEADKAAPYYRGLPALFEFTFWYKLKWALQNGIGCYFVKDILDVQPLYAQYRSDYIEATKLSNHDEDRTGSDLGQSAEKMKVAAAVLLTAQGAPYIYQGEELGYWGTKPQIDTLVFSITPDASVRYAKLQKNECQVMPYPNPADIARMKQDKSINLMEMPGLNVGYLSYNVQKKPLDDVKVRQALTYAVNKDAIIKAVYQGAGVSAKNLIPPTMWGYNDDVQDYTYDPEKAKALLKEAGLEKGFSIDLWAMPVQRPYNPNARRMAEMIQADWAKVGVQAKIVTYEWGEYLKRAKDGEHQTVMMGWTGDNGDPDNFFATLFSCAASEQGSNYSKWCYKPFEDLIQPARATDDHNKRVELYKQAQVVMHDQAPALIIAHSTVFEPVRKEVKGYVVDPLGKHHFENVSIE